MKILKKRSLHPTSSNAVEENPKTDTGAETGTGKDQRSVQNPVSEENPGKNLNSGANLKPRSNSESGMKQEPESASSIGSDPGQEPEPLSSTDSNSEQQSRSGSGSNTDPKPKGFIRIKRNKPSILSRMKMPETKNLEKELISEKKHSSQRRTIKGTLLTLGTVAACAVLVATLWLPVLRIYGNSMTPTLKEGDLVVSMKQNSFEAGDIIAFYYNNKILVKRVIAGPGDYVDIDEDGNVYVNGSLLEEEYLTEKALGETDLDYPYQVPDKHWFVMGDHRSVSLDSRTKAIGTIDESQIVGKLVTRIWPLS